MNIYETENLSLGASWKNTALGSVLLSGGAIPEREVCELQLLSKIGETDPEGVAHSRQFSFYGQKLLAIKAVKSKMGQIKKRGHGGRYFLLPLSWQ